MLRTSAASRGTRFPHPAGAHAAPGGALSGNLPLLLAVGISSGSARGDDGPTASAAVGRLVLTGVFTAVAAVVQSSAAEGEEDPVMDDGVPAGIVTGPTSALLGQRSVRTELPGRPGSLAGCRPVPILTAVAAVVTGVLTAVIRPVSDRAMTAVGAAVSDNAVVGSGAYGSPNGLHHILDSVVWFILGTARVCTSTSTGSSRGTRQPASS